MVRPGLATYGLSPVPERGDLGLRPAMTVTCPVTMLRPVTAGESVSYGHTWTATRDTTLALIPAGYADGVFRLLSNRMQVSINGRRYPNVGRVCMDQFVVDLGPGVVDVAVGDPLSPAISFSHFRELGGGIIEVASFQSMNLGAVRLVILSYAPTGFRSGDRSSALESSQIS